MEKQIDRLKRTLQRAQAQGYMIEDEEDIESPITNRMYSNSVKNPSYIGSEEAVSSLLHLKQGGSYSASRIAHQLEDVGLSQESVLQLYHEFFTHYHPFLPFLNPNQSPEQYFHQSPLLFWTIISVAARRTKTVENLVTSLSGPLSRLLWTTVGGVPGSHHSVKALCLLCTWPLPTSTTATDPTHILGGVMMKIATGIGLHRPNHAQDFSRVSVVFNQDELHDRVTTWAVCNIVAQNLGTGYGQPASSLYDWTLAVRPGDAGPFSLSPELDARLQIEKLCDKVSKEMYSNASDSIGLAGDELRTMLTRLFKRDHNDLQALVTKGDVSPLIELYVKAAGLHLRLAAFFGSSTNPGYREDLIGLWRATSAFLDLIFELEYPSTGGGNILQYGTNYICQMVVAAGFALMKLLNSFFSIEFDFGRGRELFDKTIKVIRTMSVTTNDLSWRLAELMVQMWNGLHIETKAQMGLTSSMDGSLQLKIRCRHSMSLVFDSIWRWREEFQAVGRGNIEVALKDPTSPDAATESQPSTNQVEGTLMPSAHGLHPSAVPNHMQPNLPMPHTVAPSGLGSQYHESNYEVFDPLNWMLDGLVDFPYSYAAVQGLEANGMH
ncbi:MAG: hypothetical protein M1818_006354 [Claussenomyces sp. TS43310]|nr:MAG: hypothetical protein M1818_006354 [Claussenomyces sp. TS43310]